MLSLGFEPGPLDGRPMWIHWAKAAAQLIIFVFNKFDYFVAFDKWLNGQATICEFDSIYR